jgi:hypothetical protein
MDPIRRGAGPPIPTDVSSSGSITLVITPPKASPVMPVIWRVASRVRASLFDTLKIDIHMSEPNWWLGIIRKRTRLVRPEDTST